MHSQVAAELQEDIGDCNGEVFLEKLGEAHIHTPSGATLSAADDIRCVRYPSCRYGLVMAFRLKLGVIVYV